MFSTSGIPGNPWPRDMVLRIEDEPAAIMELLWVREAYGLSPSGDLPPSLVDGPGRLGEPADRLLWEAAWAELWPAVLGHAAHVVRASDLEALSAAPDGSRERADGLARLFGPTWSEQFGGGGLGAPYQEWTERRFDRRAARPRVSWSDDPEHRALPALVPAWTAGLEQIVTIPCAGDHTRRLGSMTLLVTESTRDDPERYARALGAFASGAL
jgi:hypothetical protein